MTTKAEYIVVKKSCPLCSFVQKDERGYGKYCDHSKHHTQGIRVVCDDFVLHPYIEEFGDDH